MKKILISLILLLTLPGFLLAADSDLKSELGELRIIFQKQKDPAKIRSEADEVGSYLSKKLAVPVKTQVPGDYAAAVQAIISKRADVAYVDSLAYLLAKEDGGAKVLLAEERQDATGAYRTDYDSIFVVRKDSPYKTFNDFLENAKDARFVFTSPTSTSGYVMAYRRMVNEGLLKSGQDPKEVFADVRFGGSYAQALEQVIAGRGDICAVSYYTMEGDSANRYLPKEKREQLRILERTPGVPTHVIIVRGGLSKETEQKLTETILAMSNDRPELLTDVYGTARFKEVDGDAHVGTTKQAMQYLGLPLTQFVMKKKAKTAS